MVFYISGDALDHEHECDVCWHTVSEAHVDADLDHVCDLCGEDPAHTDTDNDHICDVDGCGKFTIPAGTSEGTIITITASTGDSANYIANSKQTTVV